MSRKKRVILAHGWNDVPTNGWLDWLARELKSRGIEVIAPAFPRPHMPKTKEWVRTLKEAAGELTKDTVLVGYSLGAPTTLRLLNDYPQDVAVAGLVLVAGFGDDPSRILNGLVKPPLDFKKIRRRARRRICIYSDNYRLIAPKRSQKLASAIEAKEIIELGAGHFVALKTVPGAYSELPVVLEAVLECFKPSGVRLGFARLGVVLSKFTRRIGRKPTGKEYT
jgi:predicted alpha/beta hydrolase family esterase